MESVNHEKECHAHEVAHQGEVIDHGGNNPSSCIRADWEIDISSGILTIGDELEDEL